MDRSVTVIGIDPGELRSIRVLVSLLRHPDPSVPELARQALYYLSDMAAKRLGAEFPDEQDPGNSRHVQDQSVW